MQTYWWWCCQALTFYLHSLIKKWRTVYRAWHTKNRTPLKFSHEYFTLIWLVLVLIKKYCFCNKYHTCHIMKDNGLACHIMSSTKMLQHSLVTPTNSYMLEILKTIWGLMPTREKDVVSFMMTSSYWNSVHFWKWTHKN